MLAKSTIIKLHENPFSSSRFRDGEAKGGFLQQSVVNAPKSVRKEEIRRKKTRERRKGSKKE
jgi:hypothetical protein